MTQVRDDWEKCRSCWIAGRATFTIDASTTIISCPMQTTTRATQRRRALLNSSMIVTLSWTILCSMNITGRR